MRPKHDPQFGLNLTGEKRPVVLEHVPVREYTQRQVMAAMAYLLELLRDLTDVDAIQFFYEGLYMQNCKFFAQCWSELVLDSPEYRTPHPVDANVIVAVSQLAASRSEQMDLDDGDSSLGDDGIAAPREMYRISLDYMVWSYNYFSQVGMRFMYFKALRPRLMVVEFPQPTDAEILHCQQWVAKLGELIGPECRIDCMQAAYTEAYGIDGDLTWFNYLHNAAQPNIHAVLGKSCNPFGAVPALSAF